MLHGKLDTIESYHPPKEDEEGYSTWQLWKLMKSLGKYIGLDPKNVFNLEIIIEENE